MFIKRIGWYFSIVDGDLSLIYLHFYSKFGPAGLRGFKSLIGTQAERQ